MHTHAEHAGNFSCSLVADAQAMAACPEDANPIEPLVNAFRSCMGQSLTKLQVTTDLGLASEPPNAVKLTVKFGRAEAVGGALLTPRQTASAPTISFRAEPGAFYTLLMTDLDAPSRATPLYRHFVHWVVCDVPGADVARGIAAAKYIGPAPPCNAGPHRYVVLLYKQAKTPRVDRR